MNYIVSLFLIGVVLCVVMQLLILLNSIIFGSERNFVSEYTLLFGETINDSFFISTLWVFALMFSIISCGFFISFLYQKMNKTATIAVSVGVPVFIFMIVPALDSFVFNGGITAVSAKVLSFILGTVNGIQYPMLSVGLLVIVGIVIFGITYLALVRKMNFK